MPLFDDRLNNTIDGLVRYDDMAELALVISRKAVNDDTDSRDCTLIGVDTDTNEVDIVLLTADVRRGAVRIIKDETGNASSKNITVTTEGSQKIDGEDDATISDDYGTLRLYCNGSHWFSF